MSSFDIKACVNELQALIDGKIEKIYHYPPDEIRIKIYSKEGRKDLTIEAGKRIHLTKFPKQSPRFPSSFAMILRKHLEGGRIRKIEQYDFDRIVKIEVKMEEKKILIAELFSKGNIILANENLEIIMPLKFRFKAKEVYKFPEPKNPVELVEKIYEFKDKEVVRALANIGLGGLYAEEVCLRAKIDKNKKVSELSDEEVNQVRDVVFSLFKAVEKPEPQIVIRDGDYYDVVPLSLRYYEKYEKKFFDEFNLALDEFYSKKIVEMAEMEERKSERLEKLKKRLEMQLETKKRFEEEMEKYKRIGDLIYENYSTIEKIMDAFKKAREKMSWDEIRDFLEKNKDRRDGLISLIKSISPKNNNITIELEYPIELSLNKTIHQIADEYYNKAKKIKEKLDGLIKAIERTKEDMEKVEEIEAKKYVESIRVVRKREWFEMFRWFVTSDGFLVIGGRNAAMNEEIVSKYLEANDLFFHTQTPGAPATILKNGQNAPKQSLIEAAKFAVTYSALWKEGKYGGEVYYVKPEQVKRAAKAGEYLPKGSFYIVGEREYVKASVSCGIGVEMDKFRVFGGPMTAVKKYCDYYVELDIGGKSPNELSKEIAFRLISMAKKDEKHLVRSIATPDEIMKFLPPGKSRIKE